MKIRTLLFSSLATLACWQIILPFVNSLSLPLDRTYGIVSRVVIEGRNPLTNYAIYFLLLLLPSLVILMFLFLQKNQAFQSIYIKLSKTGIKALRSNIFLPVFCWLLIICWLLNITQPFLDYLFFELAHDGFHLGEKIGLSLAYLQKPLDFYKQEYWLIHGFGLNVIPGIIGIQLGGYDRDIALSLLVVYLQTLLAIVFSFLILIEIAASISQPKKWKLFLIFALLYFPLYGYENVFVLIDRDTIFLLQVLLSVRWIRFQQYASIEASKYNAAYAGIIGFLIPISVFYVYDRATYSIFLFLCLLIYFAITKGRSFIVRNCAIALLGMVLSWIILSLILGWSFLPVSIKQILYWAKYSGIFTSLPYPEIKITFTDVQKWLPILLQSLYINIICLLFFNSRARGESFSSFLSKNAVTIFIFICSILYMRIALGRSDEGHIVSPGFFAVFSLVAILVQYLMQTKISGFWMAIAWACIIGSFFNMNSLAAAINLYGMAQYPSEMKLFEKTNSELIKPSYLEATQKIKGDLAQQSCFYTLTSEGIWYRLLTMKPCSKYWYLIYSTSTDSQRELIQDLQKENPRIILYSNASLGNGLDKVAKETSHLLVHQYIWEHYRPYKRLNDNWFWIRRESDVESNLFVPLPNTAVGYFDNLSALESNNNLDILAQGWALPQDRSLNEGAVFITLNPIDAPKALKFINVGSISTERSDVAIALDNPSALYSGWKVYFNKLNIPPEIVNIRAWAYNSSDRKLYELPSSSSVKTIKGK